MGFIELVIQPEQLGMLLCCQEAWGLCSPYTVAAKTLSVFCDVNITQRILFTSSLLLLRLWEHSAYHYRVAFPFSLTIWSIRLLLTGTKEKPTTVVYTSAYYGRTDSLTTRRFSIYIDETVARHFADLIDIGMAFTLLNAYRKHSRSFRCVSTNAFTVAIQ